MMGLSQGEFSPDWLNVCLHCMENTVTYGLQKHGLSSEELGEPAAKHAGWYQHQ